MGTAGAVQFTRLEADIRGRDPMTRRAARQDRSRPIVDTLKTWLEAQLAAVSQKSTIAEAFCYALTKAYPADPATYHP